MALVAKLPGSESKVLRPKFLIDADYLPLQIRTAIVGPMTNHQRNGGWSLAIKYKSGPIYELIDSIDLTTYCLSATVIYSPTITSRESSGSAAAAGSICATTFPSKT